MAYRPITSDLFEVEAARPGSEVGEFAEVVDVEVGRDGAEDHARLVTGIGECVWRSRRRRHQSPGLRDDGVAPLVKVGLPETTKKVSSCRG